MVTLRAEALAARLRDLGIATPQQLEQAKQGRAAPRGRFSAILVRLGVLRDAEAGRRLASQLGSMPQAVGSVSTDLPRIQDVPSAIWRSHRLVPMREEEGKLLLATDDPFSVFALEFFGRRCGRAVEAVLIREQDLMSLLKTLDASAAAPTGPRAAPSPAPAAAGSSVARPPTPVQPPRSDASGDEPIIRLVDSMLSEAVRMRASDVHIEPADRQLRVRYRIDGVLHDVNSPPRALHGPIVSRIKIMGGLNIAEKRLPQDGRLQLSVEGRPLDVRISVLPATHGESIVMRLLDRSQPIRGLAEMGLPGTSVPAWEEMIDRPHGSGKTTTLYGALAMLNQADRKIITVEDPVEYQLSGVNQVLVKSSIGLTFAAGLRAMLRQAPDVIMVGEIRDPVTAPIAIQAALTGRLVFSTLHTNDAPSAVTRLIDMGIAPFLVASTVQGVLAQRLVRRTRASCRLTDNATDE